MKTIFDQEVRDELQARIQMLSPDRKANWGKMNVYQMIKHCNIWSEWVLGIGPHTYKQALLGKLFGKWALKNNTKNAQPIGKNMPAGHLFLTKIKDGDMTAEKTLWLQNIKEYADFSNDDFIHDFFGKMSKEQIGIFAYKHYDHHLRQFGA